EQLLPGSKRALEDQRSHLPVSGDVGGGGPTERTPQGDDALRREFKRRRQVVVGCLAVLIQRLFRRAPFARAISPVVPSEDRESGCLQAFQEIEVVPDVFCIPVREE